MVREFVIIVAVGGSSSRSSSSCCRFFRVILDFSASSCHSTGGRVATWPCNGNNGAISCQVWARPLSNGAFAAALYNSANDSSHNITVQWASVNPDWGSGTWVLVRDLWAHSDVGKWVWAQLPARECVCAREKRATRGE